MRQSNQQWQSLIFYRWTEDGRVFGKTEATHETIGIWNWKYFQIDYSQTCFVHFKNVGFFCGITSRARCSMQFTIFSNSDAELLYKQQRLTSVLSFSGPSLPSLVVSPSFRPSHLVHGYMVLFAGIFDVVLSTNRDLCKDYAKRWTRRWLTRSRRSCATWRHFSAMIPRWRMTLLIS